MTRICITLSILSFSFTGFSQSLEGDWKGKLNAQGTEIPIVFHILNDSTGGYTATFDSPDQKAFNLACSNVIIKKDSVIFIMQVLHGRYACKINEDKKQMTGTWYQGNGALPLTITKTSDVVTAKKINRPQTPKPPFPYRSEDVEYDNAGKTIHFGATFTVPLPDPNVAYFRAPIYTAVLLITGSGIQDRDETLFGHKPFAVIADYLTRQGIAVLRVDDRSMGKTTGNFSTSTSADFANDVEAGLDYLKSRPDVDTQNIGLIGHSEGGMIAPMVAVKRKDVKFIVLLAGPGVKISELMEKQVIDVMAAAGTSRKDLEAYSPLYKSLVAVSINEKDTAKAKQRAVEIFKEWQAGKNKSMVKAITHVEDEKSLHIFTDKFVTQLNEPWFNYFIKFDPAIYLEKLDCPVLALNGEKDIQVASKLNLAGIKNALEKNNNKNFKVMEAPGLNHLFQHCKACTVEEYGELEETFDPETLKIISAWIKETAH